MKKYQLKIFIPAIYFIVTLIGFGILLCNDLAGYQYVGMVLSIAAFVFWILARIQLADNFTIGAQAHELVTTGLYSKLSHPVYYFSILAVVGIALAASSLIIGIAAAVLVLLEYIRIKREEKVLFQKFGPEYKQYKKGTWF